MSSLTAAATRPLGAVDLRSRTFLVCIGTLALSFVLLAAFLVEGAASLVVVGVGCLVGAAATTFWAHRTVLESEARLHAVVQEGEALDRANSSLRRFAFAVAHDLRTPLVSTTGMLNMAKEVATSGELEEVIQLLDRATNTAQRMDGVISGILDLATGESSRESNLVDLSEVLANSLDDLSQALTELGFEVRCDDPLGMVEGDRRHIQQVFDNLIGNAVKYARPTLLGQAPVLAVRATRLERTVRISIADNGPGIPHGQRTALLMGPRGRADATLPRQAGAPHPVSGANLGLGLPLAKLAMEECGGNLAIQTSPMGGAEFVLDFEADPCAKPLQAPSTLPRTLPEAVRADRSSYSSRTILTTG